MVYLEQSIGEIYKTFFNDEPIENAFTTMKQRYGEFPFALNVQDLSNNAFNYRQVLNVGDMFHSTFAAVAQHNPLPRVVRTATPHAPVRTHHLVSIADVDRAYLEEFIRPNRNIDRSICMLIQRSHQTVAYLNVSIPKLASEQDEDRLFSELKTLQPFAHQAFEMAQLRHARQSAMLPEQSNLFWLEQMPFSAVIADRSGHVRIANQRAEQLLTSSESQLQIRRQKLTSNQPHVTHELESALGLCGRSLAPLDPIVIGRPSGPNTLVFVQPITTPDTPPDYLHSFIETPELALVSIFDPTDFVDVPDAMLERMLNLTRQETKIVRAMAHGVGTREIAGNLDISYNTVRNHIANITRRLDANSQNDILRLVMGSLSRFPSNLSGL